MERVLGRSVDLPRRSIWMAIIGPTVEPAKRMVERYFGQCTLNAGQLTSVLLKRWLVRIIIGVFLQFLLGSSADYYSICLYLYSMHQVPFVRDYLGIL